MVRARHISSVGPVLRHVGGVKCQLFLKRVVTTGNQLLKGSRVLWLLFSIQSSDYGATTERK